MASKSADHTSLNSDHDSDRRSWHESISKPDDQIRDQNEIFENDAPHYNGVPHYEEPGKAPELSDTDGDETLSTPSAITENSNNIGDEELLKMLEQLNETIDSAHNALAEQQAHSPETVPAEHNIAPETVPAEHNVGLGERAIGLEEQASDLKEQASALDFPSPSPPPLPDTPVTKKSIVPVLATIFSVVFGFAALAALWLFWNTPENPGEIDLAENQGLFSGAAVARSVKSEERALSQVSIPAKTAAPLTSATPAPAPQILKAPEQVTKPAPPALPAIAEPPIEVMKNTMAPPAKTAALTKPAIEIIKERPAIAPAPAEKAPTLPTISKAEEAVLLKRGLALLKSGDVSSARLAYEYAALRGGTDAMYALAQTYDPELLSSWNVYGIEPDTKIALKWYGRAAQNGHGPADARVNELALVLGTQR